MDKYSYNPNSRIARRIKERERKRRRNKRIITTIVILLVLVGGGIGIFRMSNFQLPEFDPAAGFARLTAKVSSMISKEENTPAPTEKPESETTAVPEITQPPVYEEPVTMEEISPAGVYPATTDNNNLLEIFKTAEGETEKICCLTFDDGPNNVTTPQILDTLTKYGVKATFFELGEKLAVNKDIALRTYNEGHLLANHTYTQKYSTIYKDWESFWGEVQKTEALIAEITGEEQFKLVRFPGGSFNSGVYGGIKQEFRAQLAQNGYYFIDWNVDNGDDGSRNSAQVLSYVKDYCGSKPVVLLMEDSAARRVTAQSLGSVIEYLQERGYVFKRLDEICYYTAETMPQQHSVISAAADAQLIFEGRGRII